MKTIKSKERKGLFQSCARDVRPLRTRTQALCPLVWHLPCKIWLWVSGIDLWILTSVSSVKWSLALRPSAPSLSNSAASGWTLAGLRDAERKGPCPLETWNLQGWGFHINDEMRSPSVLVVVLLLTHLFHIGPWLAFLPVPFSTGRCVDKAFLWPRCWDSCELPVHYHEWSLHPKGSFGRSGKFDKAKREKLEEGSGRKCFMIYECTDSGISLEKKKNPTANINNYASFCTALCSWRRAFESIISSRRVCGRLGSGSRRAGILGELAAFVSLGVQPGRWVGTITVGGWMLKLFLLWTSGLGWPPWVCVSPRNSCFSPDYKLESLPLVLPGASFILELNAWLVYWARFLAPRRSGLWLCACSCG